AELGAVYKLTPQGGGWTESVLYSFQGGTDGASPISNVVIDPAGNLYGTTSEGGAPGCSCGTVFRLSHASDGTWTERIVHRFRGSPDAAFPYNGVAADPTGRSLLGATVHGGDSDEGAIYQVSASAVDELRPDEGRVVASVITPGAE